MSNHHYKQFQQKFIKYFYHKLTKKLNRYLVNIDLRQVKSLIIKKWDEYSQTEKKNMYIYYRHFNTLDEYLDKNLKIKKVISQMKRDAIRKYWRFGRCYDLNGIQSNSYVNKLQTYCDYVAQLDTFPKKLIFQFDETVIERETDHKQTEASVDDDEESQEFKKVFLPNKQPPRIQRVISDPQLNKFPKNVEKAIKKEPKKIQRKDKKPIRTPIPKSDSETEPKSMRQKICRQLSKLQQQFEERQFNSS